MLTSPDQFPIIILQLDRLTASNWKRFGALLLTGYNGELRKFSMRIFMQAFVGILVFGGFLAAPTMLIWGWVRWLDRPEERDRSTILSFAGFLFATASAPLAASTIAYAYSIRCFSYYDPLLL